MYTTGVPGFLIKYNSVIYPKKKKKVSTILTQKKKSWQIDHACRSAGGAVQIDYFTRVEASYY